MEWILAILIAIIAIILYKLKSDSKKFENLLLEQKEEIKNLSSQNLKLEEELKNFTEIGSDSKQLNDTVSQEEQELHIAETLETIVGKGIAQTALAAVCSAVFISKHL